MRVYQNNNFIANSEKNIWKFKEIEVKSSENPYANRSKLNFSEICGRAPFTHSCLRQWKTVTNIKSQSTQTSLYFKSEFYVREYSFLSNAWLYEVNASYELDFCLHEILNLIRYEKNILFLFGTNKF